MVSALNWDVLSVAESGGDRSLLNGLLPRTGEVGRSSTFNAQP